MDVIYRGKPAGLGWVVFKAFSGERMVGFFVKWELQITNDKNQSSVFSDKVNVTNNVTENYYSPTNFVPYKPYTDIIVNAVAYVPQKKHQKAMVVRIKIGSLIKELKVYGNRTWENGMTGRFSSEPKPFYRMPIIYDNAFGGGNSQSNPIGKGKESEDLPNIEQFEFQITGSTSDLVPAGFSAIPEDWSQRTSLLGTYSRNYGIKRWPYFPENFNSNFYNSAPKDQQIEGYLKGSEPLVFQNLHSEYSEYKTALPGLRARCFIEKVSLDDQPGDFFEVKMNLDTLLVDMEEEKLVLVWRGLTEVQSPKLKEIQSIFILSEPLNEPKHNLQYYWALMQKTIAEEDAEFEIEERPPIDFDLLMKEKMGSFDADIAKVNKEFAELEAKAEADEKRHLTLIKKNMGSDAHFIDDAIKPPVVHNKPATVLKPQIESVRAERPDLASQWEESLKEDEKTEQEMAEMDAEAKAFEEEMREEPALTREDVIAAAKSRESLEEAELSKLDLSGLDLSGMNFSGALFSNTSLFGSDLSKANLKGARFRRTILANANLRSAILDDTDLSSSNCTDTVFKDASIEGVDFSELVLFGADFSGCKGEYADFSGANLTEAVFTGVFLPRCDFDGCQLTNADFTDAQIPHSDFSDVMADGINMEKADITGLRASGNSNFTGANFKQALGNGSQWEDCILDKCNFRQADLSGALLDSASMKEAFFDRSILSNSSLADASLKGSIFTNANLLRVSFERADLTQVDFSGSNIYEAAFLDTVVEGTNFRKCNLKGTRLA